ncbi:MAG: serine/threonine protein kinase [Labilithrix sp.]|nr:serine/threonine protein kinase [Labilithrix sp.]MCW5809556.1 serine/threonine protein kinase [Labilithrix sp.]
MSEKKLDTALLPTLSNEELSRTLAMTPVRIAQLEDTVAQSPRSTIEPDTSSVDSMGRRAVEGLGQARSDRFADGLAVGATIGEGGMGLVRAATQQSLGRKVAVKTLKPEARNERATLRLLREAWVTGSLEHPNIVPVYDLGLGEDGSPIIVLKLIEGRPWSEVARDPAAAAGGDLLERNLRVFVQVCNAVSLAHARGVIHRDLKLENVMIGRFGEVYLVDWGIAVSLRPDPTGRLPLASEATEMAGTPAYMAPEMLGNGAVLSERTDVYLLGSILHELLVGKPPHAADNLRAILASIVLSQVSLPPSVPRELAAIVRRATSRDPAERFASAEELKARVEWYLRHRGSLALSDAAASRVKDIRAVLGGSHDEVRRDRIHKLFAEARFGFRQAVLACPDNEEALAGLREATTLVVEYELAEGTPEAAAAALAELDPAPPELAARVAAALEARAAEKARVAQLERIGAQHDSSTGQRTRMVVGGILACSWSLNPYLAEWALESYPDAPYWSWYGATFAFCAFAWLVAYWGRESLLKTVLNRQLIAVIAVMFATQFSLQVGGHLLALPARPLLTLHVLVWFSGAAYGSIVIDRKLAYGALGYLAAFLYACSVPQHVFHAMSLASVGLVVNIAIAWFRPRSA